MRADTALAARLPPNICTAPKENYYTTSVMS